MHSPLDLHRRLEADLRTRRFRLGLPGLLAGLWLVPAPAHAVTVDVYQNMESGSEGALLTPGVMNASSHGEFDGIAADWQLTGSVWVSTAHARTLPGTIAVGGVDYSGSSTRTWQYSDNYENNYVEVFFGSSHQEPAPPHHDHVTVACFLTPGPTQSIWNQHDTIVLSGLETFSVLQLNGAVGELHMRSHSCTEGWETTFSPDVIPVEPGKTYWVNLHHDGPAGKSYVAVFDPDDSWALLGSVVADSVPGSTVGSSVEFGRCSPHGDHTSWTDETYSYFDHILIDYTTAAFPLLPDLDTQTCSDQGGVCCASEQVCQDGTFVPASDCAVRCCVDGTCEPRPPSGGAGGAAGSAGAAGTAAASAGAGAAAGGTSGSAGTTAGGISGNAGTTAASTSGSAGAAVADGGESGRAGSTGDAPPPSGGGGASGSAGSSSGAPPEGGTSGGDAGSAAGGALPAGAGGSRGGQAGTPSDSNEDAGDDEGGCGCRHAGSVPGSPGGTMVAVVLGAVAAGSRRRRRSAHRRA